MRWFARRDLIRQLYARQLRALNCRFKSDEKKIERFMWCQTKYAQPKIVMPDGNTMPIIGLGTWLSPKRELTEAVKTAIDVGYRMFDCAQIYQNESAVGDAFEAKIKEGIVKREDLFVVSKLWNTFHRRDLVRQALEQSLDDLKVKYLDLYLIQWPMAYKEGCELFPTDRNGQIIFSPVDYVDTWKELENMVEAGLTKAIGFSNFNRKQMERIIAVAKIQPSNNQIECHPYLQQKKLCGFIKLHSLAATAYSPLGSPKRPWAKKDDAVLLEEEGILKIAESKKKTPAQLLIRYQIQRGNVVIPKSIDKEHIKSNFQVFDFELKPEEVQCIESYERNLRLVPLLSEAGHHKYYPFHDEY